MHIWVYFGEDSHSEKGNISLIAKFPCTEFSLNLKEKALNEKSKERRKIKKVDFKYFGYHPQYAWDFQKECARMLEDKTVREIEQIVEQLEAVEHYKKLDVLEQRFYQRKELSYEQILTQLMKELAEDADAVLPQKLMAG